MIRIDVPDQAIDLGILENEHIHVAISKQFRELDVTSSWEDVSEQALDSMIENMRIARNEHKERYWCKKRAYQRLMYPVIVVSAGSSVFTFQTSGCDESEPVSVFSVWIVPIALFMQTLLMLYIKFVGIAEKMEAHKRASVSYDVLRSKAVREKNKPPKDRQHANEFLADLLIDYNDIVRNVPLIGFTRGEDVLSMPKKLCCMSGTNE